MKKDGHSHFSLRYYLVLLAGILVILGVYSLCPEKGSDVPLPATSEKSESTQEVSVTEKENISESDMAQSSGPETSSLPSDPDAASAEADSSAPSESAPSASYTILDSKYQYAQGYAWDDLYALLVLIVKTSHIPEGMHPAFSLIRLDQEYDPMLLVGYEDDNNKDVRFTVYITDSGYVYELGTFSGSIKVSASSRALFLPDESLKLIYYPHVFLKTEMPEDTADLSDLTIHDLSGRLISAEELTTLVQDVAPH